MVRLLKEGKIILANDTDKNNFNSSNSDKTVIHEHRNSNKHAHRKH